MKHFSLKKKKTQNTQVSNTDYVDDILSSKVNFLLGTHENGHRQTFVYR
jgi:hypothetical protein